MATWYQSYGELPYQSWVETPVFDDYPEWLWKQKEGDLPYHNWAKTPVFDDCPELLWRQTAGGLPYKNWPDFYTAIPAVRQHEYIQVYDMRTPQDWFVQQRNGLRILTPTRCQITESFQEYELILEHPIDNQGNWEYIVEFNIIKACGQLFTIYRVDSSRDTSGTITAYAKHISYQLADGLIYQLDNAQARNGKEALDIIMRATTRYPDEYTVDYDYQFDSDIETPCVLNFKAKTPIESIMGNDATSLINTIGGEIYRDNFRISLNQRAEGSQDNAFDLRVGLNLLGIKRDVDYSSFCTHLTTEYKGNKFYVSRSDPEHKLYPHHVVRYIELTYPSDPGWDKFVSDSQKLFNDMWVPKITYNIKIKDLKNNPAYADIKLPELRLGDTGRIYDERFGIYINQKIVRRIINGVTGEVEELSFGNKNSSMTRKSKYANNILGNSAVETEAKRLSDELRKNKVRELYNWINAQKYAWNEVTDVSWNEVR